MRSAFYSHSPPISLITSIVQCFGFENVDSKESVTIEPKDFQELNNRMIKIIPDIENITRYDKLYVISSIQNNESQFKPYRVLLRSALLCVGKDLKCTCKSGVYTFQIKETINTSANLKIKDLDVLFML